MLNRNRPAVVILTDLINASNMNKPGYSPYNYLDLSFRNLRAITDSDRHDTELEVTDVEEPNPGDWVTVYYKRAPINALLDTEKHGLLFVDQPNYHTAHDLIPALNERYSVMLNKDDIEPTLIVRENLELDNTVWVSIQARKNALIIRGSLGVKLTNILPEDQVEQKPTE